MAATPLHIQIILALLPAALVLLVWCRPSFFANQQGSVNTNTQTDTSYSLVYIAVCCVAVVLGLIGFSSGLSLWLLVACAVSFGIAMLGAARLGGEMAVALIVALVILALFTTGGLSIAATNAISVAAGLGAAYLLSKAFDGNKLPIFLGAFAVLDVVVVAGGLPQAAVNTISAGIGDWAFDLPIFNRISLGSLDLGAMDIAYAVLVASVLIRQRATRFELSAALVVFTTLQAVAVGYVSSGGEALPATLPGLAALGTFAAARWAHAEPRANVLFDAA